MKNISVARRLSSAGVVCLSLICVLSITANSPRLLAAQPSSSPIYVVLWFDTEDYILPASDDAAMRLATLLSSEGIKGTFKIVGEKARVLEQRGRQDVIDAIRGHEIGYHSNFHSLHPTPAERLRNAEWDEGVEEFDRTEREGFQDVRRIFGTKPVCYGQPGSSWAAQPYGVLKRWGVSVYLDESRHVGLGSQPFWYCGLLNILNIREYVTRVELTHNSDVEKAKGEFRMISEKLRQKGGGVVSVYYHPCEFVHQQFWDAANFSRGANPPRQEWKKPAMKSDAEIEQGFENFKAYIAFLKGTPGVKFATATDLLGLYRDESLSRSFSRNELLELSRAMQKEITFWTGSGYTLSPGEIFSLLNGYLARFVEDGQVPSEARGGFLSGPVRRVESSPVRQQIGWNQFAAACLDVQSALTSQHRIPSEVWMGSQSISPADYLATLGVVVERLIKSGQKTDPISILTVEFTADRYVAQDSPTIWNWTIFPEGFHAPKIMDLARLQAWTLKPAVLIMK